MLLVLRVDHRSPHPEFPLARERAIQIADGAFPQAKKKAGWVFRSAQLHKTQYFLQFSWCGASGGPVHDSLRSYDLDGNLLVEGDPWIWLVLEPGLQRPP